MRLVSILCLFLPILGGCTHLKYSEIPEYRLSKAGPFLVSESPELWRFYQRSVFAKKDRLIQFLVKNTDSKDQVLLLPKAMVVAGMEKTPLQCEDVKSEQSQNIRLKNDQMAHVVCLIDLTPTDKNQLALKDSIIKIDIPTESGSLLSLERMYRIEEFQ